MPEQATLERETQSPPLPLVEEVRRVLFEGMKKAEQTQNWDVFFRYADLYMKLAR